MDSDDQPIGRLLSRRETLTLLGITGAGLLMGCRPNGAARDDVAREPSSTAAGLPPCVVRPEQTEGPYFVDEKLNRSDIRMDPSTGLTVPGSPLSLTIRVSRIDGGRCLPLERAQVDVWHCDALGIYSDVRDRSFDTTGRRFLRGHQITDDTGVARFQTIYPGWYPGRAVHVHFKIRTPSTGSPAHEFTSQLYFDDDLTDRIHALEPYASKGRRDVRNDEDGIYQDGGSALVVALTQDGPAHAGTFDIGLHMA